MKKLTQFNGVLLSYSISRCEASSITDGEDVLLYVLLVAHSCQSGIEGAVAGMS